MINKPIPYYKVVKIDGAIKRVLCVDGSFSQYVQPRTFFDKDVAQKWIDKHSYQGMSFRYEVRTCDAYGKDL